MKLIVKPLLWLEARMLFSDSSRKMIAWRLFRYGKMVRAKIFKAPFERPELVISYPP
jgi:hypothetical protein